MAEEQTSNLLDFYNKRVKEAKEHGDLDNVRLAIYTGHYSSIEDGFIEQNDMCIVYEYNNNTHAMKFMTFIEPYKVAYAQLLGDCYSVIH